MIQSVNPPQFCTKCGSPLWIFRDGVALCVQKDCPDDHKKREKEIRDTWQN
jgi:hypothetical protein